MKTLIGEKVYRKGIAALAVAAAVVYFTGVVCLAAEGKVTAETAKIRASADTESEVVGSTSKGKTIDILEGVKDASGTVWYKVPVGNNEFGYIRSDLVETSADVTIKAGGQAPAETTGTGGESNAEKPAATVPTAIGEQKATISQPNARIRSGASTQHDAVISLPQGTEITLIGEANDSSGKKWYQMTSNYNNKTVEGYIRSDLIKMGASDGGSANTAEEGNVTGETPENPEANEGEGAEGENPDAAGEGGDAAEGQEGGEAAEPPAEEHNDYEIVYTQNESGEYEYYLYDNINGTRQKMNDLNNVVTSANENNEKLQDQIKNNKIIIIILAVIIVILVIAVTLLLFKVRDLYYADYDEEDEEEEEEEPVRRKVRRAEPEEEEEPVRRKRPSSSSQSGTPQGRAVQQRSSQQRTAQQKPAQARPAQQKQRSGREGELRAAENKTPVQKQLPRKSQNFLLDDDEFEFEFLNMDDKDL